MADKKTGKLENMDQTYFFDLETDVRNAKFTPDMSYEEYVDKIDNQLMKPAKHLEQRFSRKDLRLRGNGQIENKMIMAQVKAKDAKTGRFQRFFINMGVAGTLKRHRFNPNKNITHLRNRMILNYENMVSKAEGEYDSGDKTLLFGEGFKVEKLMIRTVVTSKPTRVNQARLIMGARNLKVTRMSR